MDFYHIDESSPMQDVALEVANELRDHVQDLFLAQHARNQETNGAMANVVLAGLTVVWLEAVHASWNTMYGESALSLMRQLAPERRGVHRDMKRAVRDFLRRSRWSITRGR